jgi:hypothetical protein
LNLSTSFKYLKHNRRSVQKRRETAEQRRKKRQT